MADGGTSSLDPEIARIAAQMRPRAAAFIVTVYGDAVVPRGGEVWMGTLIEICAAVGISETLVRTAVSRLVAAEQLEGRRQGRRSFYRLTPRARADFDAAAALIYGPPDPCPWRFTVLPEGADIAALERQGHVRLRANMTIGPARGPVPEGAMAFEAEPAGATALLPEMVRQLWDLEPHAQAYRDLLTWFEPLRRRLDQLTPERALLLRLLLVHAWRLALLRDPRLPAEALPSDWPGHDARTLFAEMYCALGDLAEAHVEARFLGVDGALQPARSDIAGQRLAALRGVAG